jgi:hypothetical protein
VLLCLDFHFSPNSFFSIFLFASCISGSADIIDPFCRSGHFFLCSLNKNARGNTKEK